MLMESLMVVIMEVVSLKKARWENGCYRGGQFNGGGMVMLKKWPV